MAVDQHEKIRLVLNVSLPENNSFNSNICDEQLEKVNMSSARNFGYTLKKCGNNANISNFDLCDAYKIVKCISADYRIQGFSWLGKYFYENRQIFGARSAVPNFDILGNTLKCVSVAKSKIPNDLVHCQLDDVPSACPEDKDWGGNFNECYTNLCEEVGIKLAPNCKKLKKLLKMKKWGKCWEFSSIPQSWAGLCPLIRRERR